MGERGGMGGNFGGEKPDGNLGGFGGQTGGQIPDFENGELPEGDLGGFDGPDAEQTKGTDYIQVQIQYTSKLHAKIVHITDFHFSGRKKMVIF